MAIEKDVVIIGGGPAGLAAAVRLWDAGVRDILVLEREEQLGGILRQCIHDGFGLTRFGESLSGPEYAQRFIDEAEARGIPCLLGATVVDLTGERTVWAATRQGLLEFQAKAVVLAMGCRERTRGAIAIPGTRPAGIYNAGVAQSYINLHDRMVGRRAVILGSGDIGLIMARRLTLEGARVLGVFEVQSYPNGLPRNLRQCLEDYGIPLFLGHTVVDVSGRDRLESVTVAQVDGRGRPMPETWRTIPCDTLILSVGLIPENELSLAAGVTLDPNTKGAVVDEGYETDVPGIFAAGNVLQVHDLVDHVSLEAERLADSVADYLRAGEGERRCLPLCPDGSVTHTVPQRIGGDRDLVLSLRVRRPMGECLVELTQNGRVIRQKRLPKALPAEMIQLPVKAAGLDPAGALTVSVREV